MFDYIAKFLQAQKEDEIVVETDTTKYDILKNRLYTNISTYKALKQKLVQGIFSASIKYASQYECLKNKEVVSNTCKLILDKNDFDIIETIYTCNEGSADLTIQYDTNTTTKYLRDTIEAQHPNSEITFTYPTKEVGLRVENYLSQFTFRYLHNHHNIIYFKDDRQLDSHLFENKSILRLHKKEYGIYTQKLMENFNKLVSNYPFNNIVYGTFINLKQSATFYLKHIDDRKNLVNWLVKGFNEPKRDVKSVTTSSPYDSYPTFNVALNSTELLIDHIKPQLDIIERDNADKKLKLVYRTEIEYTKDKIEKNDKPDEFIINAVTCEMALENLKDGARGVKAMFAKEYMDVVDDIQVKCKGTDHVIVDVYVKTSKVNDFS